MPVARSAADQADDASTSAAPTPARGISRTGVNFLLDTLLLAVLAALVAVSALLHLVFPLPSLAGGWRLCGLTFDDWSQAQFALLALFVLLVLVHVMLHWNWICGVVASRLTRWCGRPVRIDDASRTLYGVGLLIVILASLGVVLGLAAISIVPPG